MMENELKIDIEKREATLGLDCPEYPSTLTDLNAYCDKWREHGFVEFRICTYYGDLWIEAVRPATKEELLSALEKERKNIVERIKRYEQGKARMD